MGAITAQIQARRYVWIYETKGARYKDVPLLINMLLINTLVIKEMMVISCEKEMNNNNERQKKQSVLLRLNMNKYEVYVNEGT